MNSGDNFWTAYGLTRVKTTYDKAMRIDPLSQSESGLCHRALDPEYYVIRRDLQYKFDGDGSNRARV